MDRMMDMDNLFSAELQSKEVLGQLEVISVDPNTTYLDNVVDKLFECKSREALRALIQEVYDDGFSDGTNA